MFLSSMGKWPLTWVQNQWNHKTDMQRKRQGGPMSNIHTSSTRHYSFQGQRGADRLRGWFCWCFNKIKLSLRPQHRAEVTVLLLWSKSEFPCLSAVVAVINAPAVHFKQGLREKRWEKRSGKKRGERKNLCSCQISFLLPFPKTARFWNKTTAFSLLCAKIKNKDTGFSMEND